jgi:hypothetical protein
MNPKISQYLSSRVLAALAVALLLATNAFAAVIREVSLPPHLEIPSTGLVEMNGFLYGGAYGSSGNGSIYQVSQSTGQRSVSSIFTFNGTNGSSPEASLITDSKGNLYGTTYEGGTGNCNFTVPGCGLVFELSPPASGTAWTETILYEFQGGADGAHPQSTLAFDSEGNLYGTTNFGGKNCPASSTFGCGVVYKLTPPVGGGARAETVLHTFEGGNDGAVTEGSVFFKNGSLYGTTSSGGGSGNCQFGCGTVFSVTSSGTEAILYSFQGGTADGSGPQGGVTEDKNGNIFGATGGGGASNWGTVYELVPSGSGYKESVLYSFTGGSDGGSPWGVIVIGNDNLYGTTDFGGNISDCGWVSPFDGCGVAFKLSQSAGAWAENVLHAFTGGTTAGTYDGGIPQQGVISCNKTHLCGATEFGGAGQCFTEKGNDSGCGTVYSLPQ